MRTYNPHKTKVEVRQADRHHMNFRVLLWSTGIIVVLFGLIALIFMAQPIA